MNHIAVEMKVKCFGIARDFSGVDEVIITPENDAITIKELKLILESRYPQLTSIKNYFIAVNHEYAEDSVVISESDELAIIPPVSGG